MSNIERLVRQASVTFSKSYSKEKFKENVNILTKYLNEITLQDVYVSKNFVLKYEKNPTYHVRKPILYVAIYEDHDISVSVFILKSKSKIPLHDHPMMHGFLKVIMGSVQIQPYSLKKEELKNIESSQGFISTNQKGFIYNSLPITVKKHSLITLTEKSHCSYLSFLENNIHEVSSFDGPSVFIDILAPPYFQPIPGIGIRTCTYFMEKENNRASKDDAVLDKFVGKLGYECMDAPYRGPPIVL